MKTKNPHNMVDKGSASVRELQNLIEEITSAEPDSPSTSTSNGNGCATLGFANPTVGKLIAALDRVFGDGLSDQPVGYFPIFRELLNRASVSDIMTQWKPKSPRGHGLALIYSALNDGILEFYVRALLQDARLLKRSYLPGSLLRDKQTQDQLLHAFGQLSGLSFSLEPSTKSSSAVAPTMLTQPQRHSLPSAKMSCIPPDNNNNTGLFARMSSRNSSSQSSGRARRQSAKHEVPRAVDVDSLDGSMETASTGRDIVQMYDEVSDMDADFSALSDVVVRSAASRRVRFRSVGSATSKKSITKAHLVETAVEDIPEGTAHGRHRADVEDDIDESTTEICVEALTLCNQNRYVDPIDLSLSYDRSSEVGVDVVRATRKSSRTAQLKARQTVQVEAEQDETTPKANKDNVVRNDTAVVPLAEETLSLSFDLPETSRPISFEVPDIFSDSHDDKRTSTPAQESLYATAIESGLDLDCSEIPIQHESEELPNDDFFSTPDVQDHLQKSRPNQLLLPPLAPPLTTEGHTPIEELSSTPPEVTAPPDSIHVEISMLDPSNVSDIDKGPPTSSSISSRTGGSDVEQHFAFAVRQRINSIPPPVAYDLNYVPDQTAAFDGSKNARSQQQPDDVSLNVSDVTALSLHVFKFDGEQFYKMFLVSTGHHLGAPSLRRLVISNRAVYIVSQRRSAYHVDAAVEFSEIEYIALSLRYQFFTIYKRGSSAQSYSVCTADETLTHHIQSSLELAMRRACGSQSLPAVVTDAGPQRSSLQRWAAAETHTDYRKCDPRYYVLVYWRNLSYSCSTASLAQSPARSGYLFHRVLDPRVWSWSVPDWNKSYFLLRGKKLYQFCDSTCKVGERIYDLRADVVGCRRVTTKHQAHCVDVILADDRKLQLAASGEHELQQWLQALIFSLSVPDSMDQHLSGTACCLVLTASHILLCQENTATMGFVRSLAAVKLEHLTAVTQCSEECAVILDIDSASDFGGKWVISFSGDSERSKFCAAFSQQWADHSGTDLSICVEMEETVISQCSNLRRNWTAETEE